MNKIICNSANFQEKILLSILYNFYFPYSNNIIQNLFRQFVVINVNDRFQFLQFANNKRY